MVTLLGLLVLGIIILIVNWNIKLENLLQSLKKVETILALSLGGLTGTFALYLKPENSKYLLGQYFEQISLHAQEFLVFHALCIALILFVAEKSYSKGNNAWYPILWSIIGLVLSQLVVLAFLTVDMMNHVDGEGAIALIILFVPPIDIFILAFIWFQYLTVLFGISVFIALAHLLIGSYRLFKKMPGDRLYWFSPVLTRFIILSVIPVTALVLLALDHFADSLTPESVKISRRIERARRDSLTTVWTEEQNRKLADEARAEEARHTEEERRAEEARYKRHLLYVVARFNKKDSTSRRFIILNTSRADIDSGRAIVFAHAWGEKSSSLKRRADTAEIMLRPIPSGRRDTLVVPQHTVRERERKAMRYAIDSVALVGIVFR